MNAICVLLKYPQERRNDKQLPRNANLGFIVRISDPFQVMFSAGRLLFEGPAHQDLLVRCD